VLSTPSILDPIPLSLLIHDIIDMFEILTILMVLGLTSRASSTSHVSSNVKESVIVPPQWTRIGDPPPDHRITLRVGLPQDGFHLLEKHLYEVSDPDHGRYGAHLSKKEVETLVAPHPQTLSAVKKWLAGHGIQDDDCDYSPAQDWVAIDVSLALAEEMLETVRD
jgi:tripeptidyl-peptidase I